MQPNTVNLENRISELVTRLKPLRKMLTLCVPVGLGFGSFLLLVYLHSNGAPFPVVSGSVTGLLVLIPVVFLLVFVPVSFFLGLPDLSRIFLVKYLETVAQALNTVPWDRRYVKAYLKYYVGFLIFSATSTVILSVNLESGGLEWVPIAVSFPIPLICAVALYCRTRSEDPKSAEFAGLSFVSALMSNFWFLVSISFTLTVLARHFPDRGWSSAGFWSPTGLWSFSFPQR